MNAKVRDVMTTRVDMIGHSAAFDEVAARLSELRISALPVINDQYTVTGIVYDTDLLDAEAVELTRQALRANGRGPAAAHPRRRWRSLTAGDLGAHPPITIASDEPAEHAVRLMHNCRVKLLLVMDPTGRLVGTVGPANLLAAGNRLRFSPSEPSPQGREDHDERHRQRRHDHQSRGGQEGRVLQGNGGAAPQVPGERLPGRR